MKTNKINNNILFISFIISYYFYAHYILGQINLNQFGKAVTWVLFFASIIIPFSFLFLKTKYNQIKNISMIKFIKTKRLDKSYFLIKIFITIYFLISSIMTLFYTISFDTIYFYNDFNIYLIGFSLILPIIIFSKKIEKSTFQLAPIVMILLIFIYILFNINPNHLFNYTLQWTELENNIELIKLIILLIPLFLEPSLYFFIVDKSNKPIKRKDFIIGLLIIILIPSYFYLRCGNEFGVLLTYIDFPFFECFRNIRFNEYIENADYINCIIVIFLAIYRLMFSCFYVNNIFSKNTRTIPLILSILSLIIAFIFLNDYTLYKQNFLSLILLGSISIFIVFIITLYYLFKLRENKNEQS